MFVLDTALRRVCFEQVQGHFADQDQILGGLVVAQLMVIFAEGDVELSVQSVFDGPVAAHKPVGLDRSEHPAADVVALLSNGFGLSLLRVSDRFHPNQGLQSQPAALLVHPAQVRLRPDLITHRHAVADVSPARVRLTDKAAVWRSASASRVGWLSLRPSR